METSIEELQQKFENLPEDLKWAIMGANIDEKITEIAREEDLNQEQTNQLALETTVVMFGLLHPDKFQESIQASLVLPEFKIKIIVEFVKERIFKGVIEKYAPIYKKIEEENKKVLTLDQRFSSLPKNVQDAIAQSNWKATLYTIAEKYKLTVEQMGILEETTIKVILGEIKPDKYEEELSSKITISKEDILNIVKDVNENILKKIIEEEKTIITPTEDLPKGDELPIMTEDEVPLPPYKVITNDQLPINNEDKKDDDEVPLPLPNINIETKTVEKPKETSVGITDTPQNIIEEKLKGVTVSDHTVSDHSLPKMNDPYRETF